MSHEVQIKKGGHLVVIEWGKEVDDFIERKLEREDISLYLHETVCLENGTTLKDIFVLLSKSPYIYSINTGCPFLEDLIEEALLPSKKNKENKIAALRLKWVAFIDNDEENFLNCFLDFHGVGETGDEKYSVQFSSINEIVSYPLMIDEKFVIHGEGDSVLFTTNKKITLNELLCAIVKEVSYLGPPEIRNFAIDELKNYSEVSSDGYALPTENFISLDLKPCVTCGEESRNPIFGKPHNICIKCFKKTREN